MPRVRTGVVGMELFYRMLLKLKKERWAYILCKLCLDEDYFKYYKEDTWREEFWKYLVLCPLPSSLLTPQKVG